MQHLPIVDDDDGVWGGILCQYLMKEHVNDGSDRATNSGHQYVTTTGSITVSYGDFTTSRHCWSCIYGNTGYVLIEWM